MTKATMIFKWTNKFRFNYITWSFGTIFAFRTFSAAQADFKIYLFQTNISDDGRLNFKVDDWCSSNSSYCHTYGANCECEEEDGNFHCICPSALDYTLRLAAGIAIILLIGVSVMLAFNLYRRALKLRQRRLSTNSNGSTDSSIIDPPPLYAEINIVSSPSLDNADLEKLPTYDEALNYLKNVSSPNNISPLVLNTEIFLNQDFNGDSEKENTSSPQQPPSYPNISCCEINETVETEINPQTNETVETEINPQTNETVETEINPQTNETVVTEINPQINETVIITQSDQQLNEQLDDHESTYK